MADAQLYSVVAVLLVTVATIVVGAFGLRMSRTTSDFYVASRAVSPRWNDVTPETIGHGRVVSMPWACDSTHSWSGVTHSTRVVGCCSSSGPGGALSDVRTVRLMPRPSE